MMIRPQPVSLKNYIRNTACDMVIGLRSSPQKSNHDLRQRGSCWVRLQLIGLNEIEMRRLQSLEPFQPLQLQ